MSGRAFVLACPTMCGACSSIGVCTLLAAVDGAHASSTVLLAEVGGTDDYFVAAFVMAAPPASVGHAQRRGSLGRLGTVRMHAAFPPPVCFAEHCSARGGLVASIPMVTPLAAPVARTELSGTLSELRAILLLASSPTAVLGTIKCFALG